MATLTDHRKRNGTVYVYWQESYWDKSAKRSRTRQVCIGKRGDGGKVVYNRRFSDPAARKALEQGATVAESALTGQSLVLDAAMRATGLERVLRQAFDARTADTLISLAWAVSAGAGPMYLASVWIEQNECPSHGRAPGSQDISRVLASVSMSQVEGFCCAWMAHRNKGAREQYCYDMTSISSHSRQNPFVEWGHNRDREGLAQVNLALLTGCASRIPTYYEVLPGSMSDVSTIRAFTERMRRSGAGRIRMLLDRGFYSAKNLGALLASGTGFLIPVPAHIKWARALIDECRDAVEMPEHLISMAEDGRDALYAMTSSGKMEGKRVWRHVYYDAARRSAHIASLFASLKAWEEELTSRDTKKPNEWAYERYFTVTDTPKRGRQVRRNQDAISAYKADRAGYWVILTDCEKNAKDALFAYRGRSLVESQFDEMKNELSLRRLRTHGPDTMRGRVLVQFLALIITAQARVMMKDAWERRHEVPKRDRLARHYPLAEMMMRLSTYRETRFAGQHGKVVSEPTRAQRAIFTAFGIEVKS